MQAIRFHTQGGPEVLKYEEVETPKPGPGEVLVRIRAAGVNRVDIWARTIYPVASLPHIMGSDGTGEVAELGHGVTGFSAGERVAIFPGITCSKCTYCLAGEDSACEDMKIFGVKTPGAYAEYAVAPAENIFPLPDKVSFEDAAAFPVAYITAWHALVSRAKLAAGETILIHAAGSGTSTAAIQIAKLCGAKVIATSRDDDKLAFARKIGADEVLNNTDKSWPDKVQELTGGKGVEVVLDHVGPATFEGSIASLAKCGRLVTFGATTGTDIHFDLRLLYSQQLSIIGSMLGTRAEFATLLKLLGEDKLKPMIDKTFPLSQAADAHRLLEAGKQCGKLVLVP